MFATATLYPGNGYSEVLAIEDAWNSREPEKMVFAYATDSRWRNRAEFLNGRQEIVDFLKRKWAKELDYRLIKELWAFRRKPHRCSLCV